VDGQRTQAKCGDGSWIRALTATRGTVAGGRWIQGESMHVGISSGFIRAKEVLGLSEASRLARDWRGIGERLSFPTWRRVALEENR
jgi:hypothetical protein